MSNYLVTGSAGFIGTNLCERLLKEGHVVHGVDNYISGRVENHERNLYAYPHRFFPLDESIENYYVSRDHDSYDFDYVINLACPASPIAYQRNPFQTISACTTGVHRMLKSTREFGARFLHTSTSEVYGDPTQHPQTEDYFGNVNCFGPRACYDEGKRLAETYIWEYNRKYPEVETRIVRIFNTYGPFMAPDDGRVISNFIVQALKNKPITIYGNGSQTRSFCYVDDLIDVLLLVLKGDYNQPLNVGNPSEFSMIELAQMVRDVVGSSSPIQFHDLPKDDPKQRRPDISKVKDLYGWRPKVNLKEGIEKTAAYFQSNMGLLDYYT